MRKIGIGITTHMKVNSTNWLASNADELGADSIWIGEDIGRGQDPIVLATSCLLRTQNARVGTGIIPFTVHDPIKLARAALTLQQVGEGRFNFGTGIGGLQDLKKRGIILKKPVTELRTAIEVYRQLWSGERVTIQTEWFSLKEEELGLKKPVDIPVSLGVRGPQMLQLAGEMADGVILSGPFDYLRDAIDIVDKSSESKGRTKDSVEKIVWLPTIPTFSGVKEHLARKVVAIIVADYPRRLAERLEIDIEKLDKIREAVSKDDAASAADYVDQEIVDMFSISGNLTHMVERFEELYEMGADEVLIGPPFSGNWRRSTSDLISSLKML